MDGHKPNIETLFQNSLNSGRYTKLPVFSISYYPIGDRKNERLKEILYGDEVPFNTEIWKQVEKLGMTPQRPDNIRINKDNGTILDSEITIYQNSNELYGELTLNKLYHSENPQIRKFLLPEEILSPSRLEIKAIEIMVNDKRYTVSTEDIYGSTLNIHCGETPHTYQK